MSDDDLWDKAEKTAGFTRPKPFAVVGDNSNLVFRAAALPDPTTIPPRQWLYGTQLLRAFVTILVAPGGVGKTAYAMGVGMCLVVGKAMFGDKVFASCNVAYMNLEDPLDELNRRLAALMICHGVTSSQLKDRYFLYSSDDRRLTIAAISNDGFEIVHPDEQAVIREINEHEIGTLIVDPVAESHELEENSNPQMNKAAGAWRRIARATGCAIFLIHHVRKGAPNGIDAARGAKALTDSARVGLLLSSMSEDEAEQLDIKEEDRTSFVRLDDAKANMARRSGVARWFQLQTIPLGNGTTAYPAGDNVAAITPWKPPSTMGKLTVSQCNDVLDEIAAGLRPGVRYTASNANKTSRWAGQLLIDRFEVSEKRATGILATWSKTGVLEERLYDDAEQRKPRKGLFVNEAKRPGTEIS